MMLLRTVSALSRLRSHTVKQYSLQNTVRWLQTQNSSDLDLHSHLKEIIPEQRDILRKWNAKPGRLLHGPLGGILWDTTSLDSDEGTEFCGPTFADYLGLLPAAEPGGEPLPEGLLWLLLTGKAPSKEQVDALSNELRYRATVPDYVYKAIDALPDTAHPMTQFTSGIMALQVQSEFLKAYEKGIHKSEYWEPAYEDCLNLIARLPSVAAYVYRRIYKDGQFIPVDDSLDYGANLSHMLGYDNPGMHELMRLYVTIHSYHEGGNVSAHACHLVGDSVSDPYISFAAALNDLAGPLDLLANEEVLLWIKSALNECGEDASTQQLNKYFLKPLTTSGKVGPVIGRGLLRTGNPRHTWLMRFALMHLSEDPLFRLVSKLYKVKSVYIDWKEVIYLDSYGPRKKNPSPNIDAHSAVLLNHFGLTEARYYNVLFDVASSIGICSQLIWDRALSY